MDAPPVNGESLPPLERVMRELRAQIERLGPGARLPSQNRLAQRLGVSRATVQKALDELREAHLITSTQGSGSFVAGRPAQPHIETAQPAFVALGAVLQRAISERELTIDY